jgi:EAL domain-containing protein (putative c-di-GMP-specific phosphodiesterase class I)
LQVEITESIFLKDSEKARHILQTLSHMGVKTAMDDFGTGYSNLSTINDLPLNKVKIDRSFITKIASDEKARKLFEAVATLGKNMNLDIVVEGVENVEQLESVKKVGVHLIQGFLFGKPMSNADMARTLRTHAAATNDGGNVIPILGRAAH